MWSEETFCELQFSNYTKFLNVFVTGADKQSLHCYCYIQNYQVWETSAVLISIKRFLWGKYDHRRLMKESMFYLW